MTHPLTDKICRVIEADLVRKWGFDYDDYMCMRAGADWQLEQVVEWLRNNLDSGCYLTSVGYPGKGYRDEIDTYEVVEDLQKAMRPTQEDNS